MYPSLPDRTSAGLLLLLLLSYVSLVSPAESPTSPPPPGCSSFLNCDSCVPHAKCLWCFATNSCSEYPVTWLLPPASLCPLSKARWGVCWVNFEALIIAMAVVLGTIIISIIICCCCCCCRRRTRPAGPDRDEETFSRRREEIRQRAEERKAERKTRNDEIRRKYGLMGDSDHPYSKFENE